MPFKDSEVKKQWKAKYYQENKAEHRARVKLSKQKKQQWLTELKLKHGCLLCPEKSPCCLAFHHLNGDEKVNTIRRLMESKGIQTVIDEIRKCVLVCHNCHSKLHAGLLKLPDEVRPMI